MDPLTISILANLGKAGYQFFQGQKQKQMANSLKPSNYVPPAIREAEASSRLQANASVAPGYGRFLDRLQTDTANTIAGAARATRNPNQIQQAVMDSDARNKELIKDIEVNNQAWQAQNRDKLNRVLGIKGGFERDSWDAYNATKSSLLGASMRNKYNAVSGLAEAGTYLAAIDMMSGKSGGSSALTNPFAGIFRNRSRASGGGGWDPNYRMDGLMAPPGY